MSSRSSVLDNWSPINRLDQQVFRKGFVTFLENLLVAGSSPAQVERAVGYTPGTLREGYWLMILDNGSTIGRDEFEFRGYSNVENGVPKGGDLSFHEMIDGQYSSHPVDQTTKAKVMSDGAARLNRLGLGRVVKVEKIGTHQAGYEPGSGVPQYRLTTPKAFRVIAQVLPGQKLQGHGTDKVTVVDALF